MTEDGFSALSACATIEHFPSFWPTKLSFFSCVYDNASRHCSQRNNNNNIRQKKTMHGGYKDNRRRVLTFNTLTAQKRQNMCGDVRVTFSARYWVQVYLAELARLSGAQSGAWARVCSGHTLVGRCSATVCQWSERTRKSSRKVGQL